MSELPTILVTNGWKTDRNRKLTEVVIPSTVKTLNAPTKVTFMGKTLLAAPFSTTTSQEFDAPNVVNITVASGRLFAGCTALTSISFAKLSSVAISANDTSVFSGCGGLTTVSMPLLSTISLSSTSWSGLFYSCQGLVNITLPSLTNTTGTNSNAGVFYNCTGLQSVQLGSEGHPVTALSSYTFKNCTQSGLTITIYTTGGASLSGSPWGATNATIVYETA